MSIGTEGTLPRMRTPRIVGAESVAEALARLLAGSGLVARQVGSSAWRIERQAAPQGESTRSGPTRPIPEAEPGPPIVVTATKRGQALGDAPVAVSVIPFADGEDSDARRDSAWAGRHVEGLTLAGQGAGRNRMFLRGVADSPFNGDSQSTVAVVLDDSRLTYSAPDPDIRLVDVDRVEVLKGPQGALYGTGALGGIYRIVTRRPDPSATAFTAGVGTEALASGELGVSASAMANLPLAEDVAALRVVAFGGSEPGWVDTGRDNDGNSSTVLGLRAGLGIEAANGWRIDATAFGQWLNSADSSYVYAAGARSRPAQQAEPHDNDLRHVSLRAAREGPVGVVLASGVTWHEVRDRYDATQGADGLGLANPVRLDDNRDYRTWDSELRLTGASGPVAWLAGLSHVEARQGTETSLQAASGAALVLPGDRRVTSDSAVFGEATLTLSPDLDLLAGGRLFRAHFADERRVGASAVVISRTRLGATPAVALSWHPHRDTLVYLRYGSAFRQGGSGVSQGGQARSLAGDELATLEAGWRQPVGGLMFDLGSFLSRWENVQSDTPGANGLLTTRNAGNARIVGVEASVSGAPAPGWTVEAGATWQSALLVRNATGIALDDRRLPAVPRYTLRGALSRKWAAGAVELETRLFLRYTGPARLSFQPELDLPMGDYLDSGLEAQARLGRMRFGLKLENLFGAKADTLPYGNPFRAASTRQHTPQRPPSLSLQLGWSY